MFLRKTVIFSFILGAAVYVAFPANAALSRAVVTYQQAQNHNLSYFRLLARYYKAIDIVDGSGNTAYCLALRENNQEAMRFLAFQGADVQHQCVRRINEQKQADMRRQRMQQARVSRRYQNESGLFDSDKKYLWAGAGILAVGGGIALAASGGGGGSSHNGGGSGTPPVSQNPGDDIPRGDDPLPEPEQPAGGLTDVTADTFKTEEYKKGNFLEGIKAAEAYSHIYKKDESGNLFGHQAGSDKPLEKIKVGVLDGGVFPNADIKGKVSKRYDINQFSKDGSVWAAANNDGTTQAYLVKQGSKYYYFHLHYEWDPERGAMVNRFEPIWRGKDGKYHIDVDNSLANEKIDWGLDEENVNEIISFLGGTPWNEMTLVNAGAGFPGVNLSELDPTKIVDDLKYEWGDTLSHLSHGTHVAGIIAAKKNEDGMHGVAFDNAEILGASWDMRLDRRLYNTVKQMVNDGATVFSNSWGTGFALDELDRTRDGYKKSMPEVWDSYVYAAKNGAVWVQAAGNESRSQPDYFIGMGAVDLSEDGYKKSDTAVPYLAVAALDYATKHDGATSGELAWYSNACGDASGYCLAAPGSEVLSTVASNTGNMYMDGTSMATPVVSGSIALLNGYYPWLNAQNVAYLLLETANKDGVYANSSIYGQGALDLEAAVTTPLGDLRLPENASFDSLTSARASRLALSAPLQKQMLKAMPKTVTAFDILDRPFQYDTAKLMNTTHASNANLRNAVSKMAMGGVTKTIKDEKSGFQFTTQDSLSNGGMANLSSAEVISETDTAATRFYYAANSKYATADNVLKASNNPYLAMNEAYGAENTLKLSDTSKLKLSIQTGENGLYERDYEQDKNSFNERSYALTGEYSFSLTDYLEVAALGGMLLENEAVLGMNGEGAFGVKDSSTYYIGVRAALNLTPDFSILAAYYRGYTQGGDAAMLSISDLVTESFMLAGEYKIDKANKIGLSLSSPLSVVKGRASVLFARGRDNYSDTIYMQKLSTSLKPEAKEYDLGVYYQGKPEENINLLGKVEARFNADGEKGVTDYIGIVGAGVAF